MGNTDVRISGVLKGLSDDTVLMIQQAVKMRVARARKMGSPVDWNFLERCFVEYAEEARAGRKLDEGAGPREEVVFTRNYLVFYGPPKKF